MIFYILFITISSIDVALIFDPFWNGFGSHCCWLCDTFSVRARNLQNLKKHCLYNELTSLYTSEEDDFEDFHNLFRYLCGALILDDFWHRSCVHSGTTLVSNSFLSTQSFLWWFRLWYSYRCLSKMVPISCQEMLPFGYFFILSVPVPRGAFWDVPRLTLTSVCSLLASVLSC